MSVFWTITIVAPITMKMPERKNISMPPSSSPKRLVEMIVRQQPEHDQVETGQLKSSRLDTPKKRTISATPNGSRLMPA